MTEEEGLVFPWFQCFLTLLEIIFLTCFDKSIVESLFSHFKGSNKGQEKDWYIGLVSFKGRDKGLFRGLPEVLGKLNEFGEFQKSKTSFATNAH